MLTQFINNIIDEKSVQRITVSAFKDKILEHLLKLEGNDRRLRFGATLNDDAISRYIDNINPKDILFAIFDNDLNIIGLTHFAISADGSAELGLSVDASARGQSNGSKLFKRSLLMAKVMGIHELYIHCLSENAAMKHIASKYSMTVISEFGETQGCLNVSKITPVEMLEHAYIEQLTVYDFALKAHISNLNNFCKE